MSSSNVAFTLLGVAALIVISVGMVVSVHSYGDRMGEQLPGTSTIEEEKS